MFATAQLDEDDPTVIHLYRNTATGIKCFATITRTNFDRMFNGDEIDWINEHEGISISINIERE